MQESELVNHLFHIQDFTSNLGNDLKNIKNNGFIYISLSYYFEKLYR